MQGRLESGPPALSGEVTANGGRAMEIASTGRDEVYMIDAATSDPTERHTWLECYSLLVFSCAVFDAVSMKDLLADSPRRQTIRTIRSVGLRRASAGHAGTQVRVFRVPGAPLVLL